MQLAAFEFPTTVYTVSKALGNQYLWVVATDAEGTVLEKAQIVVPNGNYSPAGLVDFLNVDISSNWQDQGFSYLQSVAFVYDVSLVEGNSGSGRCVVGWSLDNPDVFLSLRLDWNLGGLVDPFTPLPLKLGWILGFRQGNYKDNVVYVSEGMVDTNPCPYFYLVIDDYNNNVNNGFYSAFQNSLLNKNILARLALPTQNAATLPFVVSSQSNFNVVTTPRKYFGPVDIQKMHVQLLDEYGRVLDLNSMDFSFCLNFQCVYDL
jgi:hypothetical protein